MPLIGDSMRFLAVEHAFRYFTEQGTRDRIVNAPFFAGYLGSVGSLHGWSDGDPFYVNYIGHPMQGAVQATFGNTMIGATEMLSSVRAEGIGNLSSAAWHFHIYTVCSLK